LQRLTGKERKEAESTRLVLHNKENLRKRTEGKKYADLWEALGWVYSCFHPSRRLHKARSLENASKAINWPKTKTDKK
jgi:hypothetical protein